MRVRRAMARHTKADVALPAPVRVDVVLPMSADERLSYNTFVAFIQVGARARARGRPDPTPHLFLRDAQTRRLLLNARAPPRRRTSC